LDIDGVLAIPESVSGGMWSLVDCKQNLFKNINPTNGLTHKDVLEANRILDNI
jgi:hypothetical protein